MIGLETWFNNFTQFINSNQTPETLADIPLPRTEYAIWWTMKCAELSAFLGGAIVHPIYRLYLIRKLTPETTTNNSRKVIRNLCRRIQGRFLIGGLVAGPFLSVAWTEFQGWNERKIRERCYQIRCNTSDLVLDRYATTFFLVGWYWKRFQGGVDGINIAIAYYMLYKGFLERFTNPMLVDRIKPEQRYTSVEDAKSDRDRLTRFWKDLALKGKTDDDLRPKDEEGNVEVPSVGHYLKQS